MLGQSISILNLVWARQGGNLRVFNLPLYCFTSFYLRSFVSYVLVICMFWLGKKYKKLKNGPGYQKNKIKNNKIKKKQAWYQNSKEPNEGPAWQNFKK